MLSTVPAEVEDALLPAAAGASKCNADMAASSSKVELAGALEGAPTANEVEELLLPNEADPYEDNTSDLESEWRVGRAWADALEELRAEAVGENICAKFRFDFCGSAEALAATEGCDADFATTDAKLGEASLSNDGRDAAWAPEDGSETEAADARLDLLDLVGGGGAGTEQRARPNNDGDGNRAKPDRAF